MGGSKDVFQCCFCGSPIVANRWDPCELTFEPGLDRVGEKFRQTLYAHATCFASRVDQGVKLYALDSDGD